MGCAPSFSAHVRWGERGAPVYLLRRGFLTGSKIRWSRAVASHISRKTSEMPRISCTRHWTRQRVRLSLGKGAWDSRNPRNFSGNRGCGAPLVSLQVDFPILSCGTDDLNLAVDPARAVDGLRPIVLGPSTLGRTWGTRLSPPTRLQVDFPNLGRAIVCLISQADR
jgi:hypothetical protein